MRGVLTSKGLLAVGAWAAVTATLVAASGVTGETASHGLLVVGFAAALALSRGPRESR